MPDHCLTGDFPRHPSPDSDGISTTAILVWIFVPLAFIAASFSFFLCLALGNSTRLQRSRGEGTQISRETEPLIQDGASWCPPAPPPRPAFHTPPAPPFPPPPYIIITDDADWVATQAMSARNRRPDPPSASPHPPLYSSRQAAAAPTDPVVRAYGATNQHLPRQPPQDVVTKKSISRTT